MGYRALFLGLAAHLALGLQIHPRDTSSNDPYPFCNTKTTPSCIEGGKWLYPALDFSLENDAGDLIYQKYLPSHTYTLSQWAKGKMPEACYYWGVTRDQWVAADFTMWNVTYSDCSTPYVVCRHKNAPKTIDQIATTISKIPAGVRQAVSLFLVYSDKSEDNPNYGGYMATYAPHGIIIGRSTGYFVTSLVHEFGHAVDANLASLDAPHPGSGTSFSATSFFQSAANMDGYAVSAYGTTSFTEDFPEVGRAVLIDQINPGGLAAFYTNANITHIYQQMGAVKKVAGSFYKTGTTCDKTRKFPYPPTLVSV
ncbi:hypothetical protein GQ53DRAFT_761835 [Thozetella sp. PMI_491]|nr:hypothetical protein GQ53DRAFT_761835 [Thozetella sp. PMI_491]